MDPVVPLIDLVIHFDTYLRGIIDTYGLWTYLILFVIIFCETGFLYCPISP
jgi:membrane-associated protein